jgi:hypothetical protein
MKKFCNVDFITHAKAYAKVPELTLRTEDGKYSSIASCHEMS